MRKFVLLALLLTGLPSPAQSPASQIPVPTIRANTRMILLSVIATDKSGPVTDLTANEFSVLENGRPQKLATFAFEQPTLTEQKVEKPLPPNVYTNRPTYLTPSGPLTILLLDALNTQATDQTYFRRELLQYLANQVRPGQRLAVFALGEQLHLLQNFTSDPALLRGAVEGFTAKTSIELQQDDVFVPSAPKDITQAPGYLRMLRTLKQLQADHGEMTTNQRVAETLAAFRTIARSVAGYPERKNLVWVSSSFPLGVISTVVPLRGRRTSTHRSCRRSYRLLTCSGRSAGPGSFTGEQAPRDTGARRRHPDRVDRLRRRLVDEQRGREQRRRTVDGRCGRI